MKILILTQYFPPEMGAPQARLHELATRLRDRGHTITVLTAMPNYPTGRVFPEYRRRLRTDERWQDLRLIRTAIYPSISTRKLPRLLSYLSFGASALALGSWGLKPQDLVLVESPPLFLIPSGIAIARRVRARLLLNVSDIWPDIIVRMGHATPGLHLSALEWLERLGYRNAAVVALTNPGAADQVRSRFPDVVTTVISNGVDTSFFCPGRRDESVRQRLGAEDGDFLVGYCGLHGLAQGLEAVIDAAARLAHEPRIRFFMMGNGPTKTHLREQAQARGLANLCFHDARPKAEMPAILASCDLSLVPLSCALPGTMPSKIYEALASGTPPIVARHCEGERLVEQFNAGRAFTPMDGDDLADRILELYRDRDEHARVRENAVRISRRFDRELIADQTEKILLAVAEGRPLPPATW